ncbi:MAG: 50S ribosomal protein L18 [Candidatus Zixiibacteriota bacterium]
MTTSVLDKQRRAERRRRRVRRHVFGTAERPRLTVAKSLKNVFAQLVNDEQMVTLVAAASNSKEIVSELKDGMKKTEVAFKVGELIARLAKGKGITRVVFDRNRNVYHGRVKAVAEGARKGGLEF